MTDPDIVTRLREADGGYFMRQMFTEAADEIERLRAERDEARLLAIALQVQQQHKSGHPNYLKETEWQTGRRIARERGWDCFKEGT